MKREDAIKATLAWQKTRPEDKQKLRAGLRRRRKPNYWRS